MAEAGSVDYYEVLQVNSSAEQETIQRVFRLLAQRFHPDNRETGDERRFREIQDAYSVLNDPEKRALRRQLRAAPPQPLAPGLHRRAGRERLRD